MKRRVAMTAAVTMGVLLATSGSAFAGSVSLPHSFASGTPAKASEVNADFAAVKSAVDDNHNRLNAVETGKQNRVTGSCTGGTAVTAINANGSVACSSSPPTTVARMISVPATGLSVPPGSTVIRPDAVGLRWSATFAGAAQYVLRAPSDYAGGPVKVSVFFQTTTATAGVVAFFLRSFSYNPGEGLADGCCFSQSGVNVAGKIGFGTVYQQDFTISESRVAKAWWITSMQRGGSGETYTDDVIVQAVALEYQATP